MKHNGIRILVIVSLIALSGFASADRLPNQTPENQQFIIDSVINVTGAVDDATSLSWVIATPGSIPEGILDVEQAIADVTYRDTILTNGGKISENQNFDFHSGDQSNGLYTIEAQKVLTYTSTEGAHMVGEEEYTLSVSGNYAGIEDTIRCVFAESETSVLPAFCNIVSAKSNLVNVNSAQISSKGQIRSVAETADVAAEMNYQIAVTPDANSGSGFAEGTVKTAFAGSILEARDADEENWNKTAAENSWKDTTEVTGGIKNLQKAFAYHSGVFL